MIQIPEVISFSGGRTSGHLVYLKNQERLKGADIHFLFMDTGAEHPGTYQFVRDMVKHWDIPLICLRVVVNPELGQGNSYRVISVDEIGPDLKPWRDICEKYGTPYLGGPFCTRTMKTEVFERYCRDMFGKGNYRTWLGIRADEPKRLKDRSGVSYLADISPFEKQDVLDWWKEQPFDLQIPGHLGNCVFCVKKSINKLALAARDEPALAADFWQLINDPSVRVVERRQQENKIMYRGNNSLESIIALFSEHSREDIASTIKGGGGYDSGSCSESCDIYNDDDEGENEQFDAPEPTKINPYCRALTELQQRPSHKLKEIGDQWRTPEALWWGINAKYGPFSLDLFADDHNAKCDAYYTAENNALTQDWSARLGVLGGAAYANPPYSRAQQFEGEYITGMVPIMQHAAAMREKGGRYVFFIKVATSESWWPENADHIAFVRGRISFDLPDWYIPAEGEPSESSAGFGMAIAIFDKTWTGPATSYISREELESTGRMILTQIHRAAMKLVGVAA
ncbi:phage N-6-adenine-methyltransferase [Erwinia sp. HR93]|uniref:phage N-6-adenine-methyltransferase n=1 Tax=Erwinia sp. HR93 TaxID=3094840 RepID=UPI002ADECE5B|nr:phage N-6-adenine-methyltransferase [Erwinia sp. HR93]MEA1064720.1 phage N-6-adenine-methyltransferase [Erwinia sp. HR93]